MKHRRIRITQLFVLLAIVVATSATALLISSLSAEFAADDNISRRAISAVLPLLLIIAVALVALAWLTGRVIVRTLSEVTAAALARADNSRMSPMTPSRLAELFELQGAVDRLAGAMVRREAELEQQDEQRRIVFDALSEAILQLDGNGRVVRANDAARQLFGLAEQPSGQPISTQIRSAELRRILHDAVAGHAPPATELALDDRRLLVSVRPLPARNNNAAGVVVAAVDLTEVRRLEGVRRDFVANVSHELKTPLTSIRGYIETLLTDDLPDDMRLHFLEVVRKNASRLQHIIDDLLDLSRLQSGGWRPELRPIDANDVIDDVISTCRDRAFQRGIRITATSDPITVMADADALQHILSNLLDNALRYTPNGGTIEIATQPAAMDARAGTVQQAGFRTIEVRDTGSGIPSDSLPRIFERFYRVDPARSREEGGTGLGLAIVKHLVESMGGDVGAESTLGKGTTIRFRLPTP